MCRRRKVKDDDKIILTQSVELGDVNEQGTISTTSTYKYIYTFEEDVDDMYKFVSRVKENN